MTLPKQYKIKRYHKSARSYRAKPHPVTILLGIVLFAGLLFLGASVYEPVSNFIRDSLNGSRPAPSQPEEDPLEAPSEPSEPEETEPEAPEALPLKTVYLPHDTAKDATELEAFLSALPAERANAVMVDIKDGSGNVLYNSSLPEAAQWGAIMENPLDLKALAQTLESKNLRLVVRMSAFQDPLAARADYNNAIRYEGTEVLWLDNFQEAGGKPWLNPYAESARAYISGLALEAAELGAELVVLENYQFPAYSGANADFGETGDLNRQEALAQFTGELTEKLAEKDARLAIYVTAISLTQPLENETRYGGSPLLSAGDTIAFGVLPYQFGGDYEAEGLVVTAPIENPGAAVEAMLAYLTAASATATRTVIPLIQGGPEPTVLGADSYSRIQVDAQISAVEARDIQEYILYSTEGDYALS